MRVRVTRTIKAQPTRLDELLALTVRTAEHVAERTDIRPDVFAVRYAPKEAGDVKVFTDFDSLAQYEELFLAGLLSDAQYLDLAEEAAQLVRQEPRDELLVLLDRDDFFLNYKDQTSQEPINPPRGSQPLRRYRLMRHVDVSTGRLREYMKRAFEFADRFQEVTSMQPEVFCTRFAAERIGCSQVFYDYDDCPMCGPLLLGQERELADAPGLLERPPIDELYQRIGHEELEVAFRTVGSR